MEKILLDKENREEVALIIPKNIKKVPYHEACGCIYYGGKISYRCCPEDAQTNEHIEAMAKREELIESLKMRIRELTPLI